MICSGKIQRFFFFPYHRRIAYPETLWIFFFFFMLAFSFLRYFILHLCLSYNYDCLYLVLHCNITYLKQ